jgi:hypothetical protein
MYRTSTHDMSEKVSGKAVCVRESASLGEGGVLELHYFVQKLPLRQATIQANFNPWLRVEISGEEKSCAARVPGLRAGDVQPDPDWPALHRADP